MLSSVLEKLEADREIALWRPLGDRVAIKRCLWITKAAHNAIDAFISSESTARAAALAADLGRFVRGGKIRVPNDLKRLKDPPADEIWEIRSRLPRPEFRLVGAFLRHDELVILQAAPREAYDGGNWTPSIKTALSEWDRLFPSIMRHTGLELKDYVSETDPEGSCPVPR